MNVLQDSTTIVKNGDKYVFETVFRNEMTYEELLKYYKHLKTTEETIQKMLSEMDLKKALGLIEIDMEKNRKEKQLALEHFNKFFDDNLRKMRENKLNKRREIQEFLKNYDIIKKQQMEKYEKNFKTQESNLKAQLEQNSEVMAIYEKHVRKD